MKGIWAKEETCLKVSPLTLTRVIKVLKSRKRKEMEIGEATEDPQEEEEEEQVGMEQIPEEAHLPVEDEVYSRISPVF